MLFYVYSFENFRNKGKNVKNSKEYNPMEIEEVTVFTQKSHGDG